MTRNFKQHGRDDERPYSRYSSDRYEGEQSSRPPRPRLNRASVDRAWESGARQQHPDYRPRNPHNTQNTRNAHSSMPGQPYQTNRRNHPSEETSPDSRNYRKPPFQRQENRRFDDRPPRRYEGQRSYDSGQRAPGYNRERPRYAREGEQQDRRPTSFRSQERAPYAPRRDDTRAYGGAPRRSTNRANYADRSGEKGRSFKSRENRPDARNPRFQSRPERFSPQPRRFEPKADNDELFEGDYERFDADNQHTRQQERHVTELPDGRVLKGNRKEQREAAAFWTDVNEETESLVQDEPKEAAAQRPAPVKRVATGKKGSAKPPSTPKGSNAKSKRAARENGESRARKAPAKVKSARSASGGTRPSQRGYKWPKAE